MTCNTALSACEKASRWELALHLLSGKYSWELGSVGYGAFLTSCRHSARWTEALTVLRHKAVDSIGLSCAVTAAETASNPKAALALLQQLLLHTSKQLLFACRIGGGPAANRAHAASTGGLDALEGYGLLHLGGLSVTRTRVRVPALEEFQGNFAETLAESRVLQSLCDLGRPCTRDTLEQQLEDISDTELNCWQQRARDDLTEMLSAVSTTSPSLAMPVQAAAQRIAAWTSLELEGQRGRQWHLCGAMEVVFGGRR